MSSTFRKAAAALVAAMAMAAWLLPASPSYAANGDMITPATGQVTGIYGDRCGSGVSGDHRGYDISTSGGGPILAAAAGRVVTRVVSSATTGYGTYVVIDHGSGYRTLYGHLVADERSVIANGASVQKGQQIGQMGNTGRSTGVHLHFEVQIDGASQSGPNSFFRCNTRVEARTPIQWEFPGFGGGAPATERIGVLRNGGDLQVKDGIFGAWVVVAHDVKDFSLSGNRIGVVTEDGRAEVKEGALNAGWTRVYNNAQDIELDGSRIGVIDTNGTLRAKEGAVNAAWVVLTDNVQQTELSGNRIAVRNGSNVISVKEGPLNAAWTTIETGTDVSLDGQRIGVVSNGVGKVKEGAVNAGWTNVSTSTARIVVSGNRIAVNSTTGRLSVKEGAVNAAWTDVRDSGVSSFALSGTKIADVNRNTASVKDGALNAGWTTLETGVTRIDVTG